MDLDKTYATAPLQHNESSLKYKSQIGGNLASSSIDQYLLTNNRQKLSAKKLAQVLTESGDGLDIPELEATRTPLPRARLLEALQHLVRSAPTLGQGLAIAIPYLHHYTSSIYFRMERNSEQFLLHFENTLPCSLKTPSATEKTGLLASTLIAKLLGAEYQLKSVDFSHVTIQLEDLHQSVFDCPLRLSQPHNALALHSKNLRRACTQKDPTLHAMAHFYLESHYGPSTSLATLVQRLIIELLPTRACSLIQVAETLGLNPRTLQRRLAKIGTEFEVLVDHIRCRHAKILLLYSTLSIAQIASELGYQQKSSFGRAHLRWYGATPLEHRQHLGPARIASISAHEPHSML